MIMTILEQTIADKLLNEINTADQHRRANVIEEYRAFLDATKTRASIDNPHTYVNPYTTSPDVYPYTTCTVTSNGAAENVTLLAVGKKEIEQHGGQE